VTLVIFGGASNFVMPTANLSFSGWVMGDASTSIIIAAETNSDGNSIDLRKVDYSLASVVLLVTTETGSVTDAVVTFKGSYDGIYTANEVVQTGALTELSGASVDAVGAYAYSLNDSAMSYFNYAILNVAVSGGTSLSVKAYLMARGAS